MLAPRQTVSCTRLPTTQKIFCKYKTYNDDMMKSLIPSIINLHTATCT